MSVDPKSQTPDPTAPNDPSAEPPNPPRTEDRADANAMMLTGAGIGVIGVVSAAIGGAVCPVCVVAAPALLGFGAFRRWRSTRAPTPAKSR